MQIQHAFITIITNTLKYYFFKNIFLEFCIELIFKIKTKMTFYAMLALQKISTYGITYGKGMRNITFTNKIL